MSETRAGWRAVGLEEWIFLALVVSLPLMQPLYLEIGAHAVVPSDALAVMAFAGLAASVLAHRRVVHWNHWHAYLALYLAASTASTLWSGDVRRSAIKLIGVVDLIGMAVLTTAFVTSAEALRRAIAAWLVGLAITVAAAWIGIAMFEAGVAGSDNIFLYSYGSLPPGPYPRVMALFLNANMLCTYVVAGTLMLFSARAAGWIGGRVFGILLIGSVVTALASLSPGLGGLALATAMWSAAWLRRRNPAYSRLVLSAGWAVAVAMVVAVTISPVGLSARTLADGRIAPSSRVLTWTSAWHTFIAHPFIGKGIGLAAADVHYVDASGAMEALTDAHNTWLSLLAQQGIAGLGAFVLVLAYGARRPRPLVVDGAQLASIRTGLYLALVGGFLYPSVAGSFESTRHVWVLMGLAAAARSISERAPVSARAESA